MRIIRKSRIREYIKKHPDSATSLNRWLFIMHKNDFSSFNEIRSIFKDADTVKEKVVFNIHGNKYRLITFLDYRRQIVFIKFFGTHAEYDKYKF